MIICDVDMPGMDGAEFIRRVAERGLASAIAIASGLDRRLLNAIGVVGEGYGLQVLGTVEKPLTARRLSELLDEPTARRAATARSRRATRARERSPTTSRTGGSPPTASRSSTSPRARGAARSSRAGRRPARAAIAPRDVFALLQRENLTTQYVDRLATLAVRAADGARRRGACASTCGCDCPTPRSPT